jgi:prolipoprotein diacylglyceryltransferase
VAYPPWSLPWYQLAGERLSCRWDGALAEGEMTAGLQQALGPLTAGTPPLIPTQLIEAAGALAIFALILLYQWKGQRKAGQSFALLILLQCPLRWIDEHLRRDHDYFFDVIPGYPLTVTQVTSGLFFLVGVGLMIWLTRRGQPLSPAPERATHSHPMD